MRHFVDMADLSLMSDAGAERAPTQARPRQTSSPALALDQLAAAAADGTFSKRHEEGVTRHAAQLEIWANRGNLDATDRSQGESDAPELTADSRF
jgi:hypothetical protein